MISRQSDMSAYIQRVRGHATWRLHDHRISGHCSNIDVTRRRTDTLPVCTRHSHAGQINAVQAAHRHIALPGNTARVTLPVDSIWIAWPRPEDPAVTVLPVMFPFAVSHTRSAAETGFQSRRCPRRPDPLRRWLMSRVTGSHRFDRIVDAEHAGNRQLAAWPS